MIKEISQDLVRKCFSYEITGKLKRKVRTSQNTRIGDVAGICKRALHKPMILLDDIIE